MSEITNITIKNIKGFMNNDNSFDVREQRYMNNQYKMWLTSLSTPFLPHVS